MRTHPISGICPFKFNKRFLIYPNIRIKEFAALINQICINTTSGAAEVYANPVTHGTHIQMNTFSSLPTP